MTTKKTREQLNSELLPCPFCGGKAEIRNESLIDPPFNYQRVYVTCLDCGSSTGRKISDGYYEQQCSDEEIAALWNLRRNYLEAREMFNQFIDRLCENTGYQVSLEDIRKVIRKD